MAPNRLSKFRKNRIAKCISVRILLEKLLEMNIFCRLGMAQLAQQSYQALCDFVQIVSLQIFFMIFWKNFRKNLKSFLEGLVIIVPEIQAVHFNS